MRVSIELFVLQNFVMNTLILSAASRMAQVKLRFAQLMGAAALGCVYAVCACLPFGVFLQGFLFRVLCILVMVGICCLGAPVKAALRAAGFAFVATFLLGGTGFGLLSLLGARGYSIASAVLTILVGTTICVAFAVPVQRRSCRLTHQVTVQLDGRTLEVEGVMDTGNSLREPLSDLPVMVLRRDLAPDWSPKSVRPVPFSSLGGRGVLDAFYPDELRVDGAKVQWYVALYPGQLECAALLPWIRGDKSA